MSANATRMSDRWRFLIWSAAALVVLIPLCAVLSGLALAACWPKWMEGDGSMSKLFVWSVAAPVLLVAAIAGWRWSAGRETSISPNDGAAASSTAHVSARPGDVLEVIGLGVTLDKYRQGRLWAALSQGDARTSIREHDPKKYPWAASSKDDQTGSRACDALENGAKELPMYWGMPSFAAGWSAEAGIDRSGSAMCDTETTGMVFQLFVGADGQKGEHTDRVLERVFSFFDEHPDVPFVVVSSSDDLYTRNLLRPKSAASLVNDGYYVPPIPDSAALFVLARRDRVDKLRPFVFKDADEDKYNGDELNRRSISRRLMVSFLALAESVPKPEGYSKRTPTVAEWLQAARTFSQRADIYPHGFSKAFEELGHDAPSISKDFKPTPWFPVPWNTEQLAAFDKLPTLGFIHRPVFVPMVKDGLAMTHREDREAALATGLQQALQALPESERRGVPMRVVTATGASTEQRTVLTNVLNQWPTHGGPSLDSNKPGQWIDTDVRLGNTGAATWFMQMAIGVMGSYQEGGASAAINLRDPSEASIVLITPPSVDKRKTQHNAAGGDVWRSIVGPSVDPDNYRQP